MAPNLFKKVVWVAVLLVIALFAMKYARQGIEKVSIGLNQMWASMAQGRLDMLHAQEEKSLTPDAGDKQSKTAASKIAEPGANAGIWKCVDNGKILYTDNKADAKDCKALNLSPRPAGPFTALP